MSRQQHSHVVHAAHVVIQLVMCLDKLIPRVVDAALLMIHMHCPCQHSPRHVAEGFADAIKTVGQVVVHHGGACMQLQTGRQAKLSRTCNLRADALSHTITSGMRCEVRWMT